MFSAEVRSLLAQVISSWQVLTVTVILVIYIFLINYVTRAQRRLPSMPKVKKKSKSKASEPVQSDNEELGLEEDDILED